MDPIKEKDRPQDSDSDEEFFRKLEKYRGTGSMAETEAEKPMPEARPYIKLSILQYVIAYYTCGLKVAGLNRRFRRKYPFYFQSKLVPSDATVIFGEIYRKWSPFEKIQVIMEVLNLAIVLVLAYFLGDQILLLNRVILLYSIIPEVSDY